MRYKGINYCRQREVADCVQVSIINALKWAGRKVSYNQDIEFITKTLKTDPLFGTDFINLHKYINNIVFFKRKEYVENPTFLQMRLLLKKGGVIIFSFYTGENYHSTLIIEDNKDTFKFVNYYSNETITDIPVKQVKILLEDTLGAFFIEK